HAEPRREDLREARSVALAMVMGPEVGGDAAVGCDAHLRNLVEAVARAHHAGEARRRDAGGFDVSSETDTPQLSFLLRNIPSLLKRLVPAHSQGSVKNLGKVSAVVGRAYWRLVRHRFARDQIAAADFGAVEPELERRLVREALEHVAGLGPPGAPLHGLAQTARSPHHQRLLRIVLALVAETAADIARHDPQLAFVDAELFAHEAPDVVRRLRAAVERVAGRDRAAGLDRGT